MARCTCRSASTNNTTNNNSNNNNNSGSTDTFNGRATSAGTRRMTSNRERPKTVTVKSPSNKAFLRTDPLFHLYLICVGLITLSILAIKVLVPGMRIYVHTMIGFAFLLAIIAISNVYTIAVSKKVSNSFDISIGLDLLVRWFWRRLIRLNSMPSK